MITSYHAFEEGEGRLREMLVESVVKTFFHGMNTGIALVSGLSTSRIMSFQSVENTLSIFMVRG